MKMLIEAKGHSRKIIFQGPRLGNCDIPAEQNILFMNEMERYKICQWPKGWVQKIFWTL